jgi:hypothetical protein
MRSALSSQLVRAFFVFLAMAYPFPIQRPAAMAEAAAAVAKGHCCETDRQDD